MAEPKRRDRPKGAELRASLKTKKPVRTPALEEFGRELTPKGMEQISGARARIKLLEQGYSDEDISKKDMAGSTDPYLSRNEFKEGFYDQPKPPVSYETLKGTAAKPIPNITDTESFADGGSVRGQKNIQVKKKQFRGIF
jgi:hypothetical protein